MRLQVAKWGNSLAVRLPVECIRAAGLKEGDEVEAEMTPIGKRLPVSSSIFCMQASARRITSSSLFLRVSFKIGRTCFS